MVNERRTTGAAAILGAAVIWGTVGPVQVLTGTSADPGALGAGRLLIGGTVLMIPIARRFPLQRLLTRPVLPWVVLAAVSTAVYQAAFLAAIDRAGAALGTTVALGCAPFATGLFAWWWRSERPDRRWLVATAAAVAGCALVLAPSGAGAVDPVGVAFAVLSGCCYGAYTVAAKVFLDAGLPPLVTVAPTLVLGGALLAPFLLTASSAQLTAPSTLTFLAWSGLVGTALAYAVFATGLQHTTAATAGTLSLAEPLTAAAICIVALGEHLTAPALAGCLVLLAGLIVVSVHSQRQPFTPRPALASTPPAPSVLDPLETR